MNLIQKLPFPSHGVVAAPDVWANSLQWAARLIDGCGQDAALQVLKGAINSVITNDGPSFRRWRNIGVALGEWTRPFGPNDSLH